MRGRASLDSAEVEEGACWRWWWWWSDNAHRVTWLATRPRHSAQRRQLGAHLELSGAPTKRQHRECLPSWRIAEGLQTAYGGLPCLIYGHPGEGEIKRRAPKKCGGLLIASLYKVSRTTVKVQRNNNSTHASHGSTPGRLDTRSVRDKVVAFTVGRVGPERLCTPDYVGW